MHNFGWILTLCFMLLGCLRPNYVQQYVDVPQSWRIETDESSTLCNLRWWEQFEDPVLSELIWTALENNQDLQVAISRVYEYYARLGITNADLFPMVTGNASYSRSEASIAVPVPVATGINRTTNQFLGFFNLNWELDFWGRVISATEAACAELLGQVEARRALVITVVTSVANAYFELRALDAQLEISRKTLKSRLESLELAKDRFNLGETSEIEVKQAESEVEIAAIRAIQLERDIPIQENRLSILIGENPHSIERGLVIDAFKQPMSIPAGIPSDLLIRRPDIVQAEDNLIAANARVTEARALFFPQISLTGLYGSQSDTLRRFITSPAEMWQFGLSAIQTIFDAGRIAYEVKAAKAFRDEVLFEYRQTILNAFREVDDALVSVQKNRELVLEHQRQVKVLADYLHLAQLRYAEGEIDYLNVLDAERSLFDAELALAQAHSDSVVAIVRLYGALGGGWVNDADAVALTNAACRKLKCDESECEEGSGL